MKYLLLALILAACGPSYHLRRAEYHLKKAELKGAVTTSDTVYIDKSVIVEAVKTDTVFKSLERDTVRIEKDRLKIKYVRLPGDSVYISGTCESDTITIRVPVEIVKQIRAESWLKWWYLLIALAAGALVVRVFGK